MSRMRELAVQAANEGTMDTTQRGYLDQEFTLQSELDRIVNVTEYNGQKLLDGAISAGTTALDFQVGMNNTANDRISMSITTTTTTGLSIDTDSSLRRHRHRRRLPPSMPRFRRLTPNVQRLVPPRTVLR